MLSIGGDSARGLGRTNQLSKYCDYCDCEDCVYGAEYLTHAQTVSGRWICSTCYSYEVCIDAKASGNRRGTDGPCDDLNCKHRPKLATEFMP